MAFPILSALKLAVNAGSHIYKKKQETKMMMANAQAKHAEKIKMLFDQFQQLPSWFTNLWILVVASIYGIKGTQIFKGGKK